MKKFGLLFSIIVLLTACASKLPNWMQSVPADTKQYFISMGSGNSFAEAQQNALEQLSNRLIVNVQSDSRTDNKKLNDGTVSQSFRSLGTLQSEAFDFVAPRVIESYQDQQFHVLVSIEKAPVFAAINRYLSTQIKPLISFDSSPTEVIKNGITLWPRLKKTQQYLDLLRVHGQPRIELDMLLKNFQQSFIETMRETSIRIVVANTELNKKLHLKETLGAAYQELPTSINNPKFDVQLVVVGSQLSEYREAPFYAAKLSANKLIIIDDNLVAQNKVAAFAAGNSESQIWQKVKRDFIRQLTIDVR